MTERHVRNGNRCLKRQRDLVARIDKDDPGYDRARQLLALFQRTQVLHLMHRRRVRLALEGHSSFFDDIPALQPPVPWGD